MPPPFYFTAAWRRRVERKGGGETLGEGRKGPRVPFPVHSHSHSPEGPAKPAALVQEERRKRLAGFKGGRGKRSRVGGSPVLHTEQGGKLDFKKDFVS